MRSEGAGSVVGFVQAFNPADLEPELAALDRIKTLASVGVNIAI
jgi:hypothetical protein